MLERTITIETSVEKITLFLHSFQLFFLIDDGFPDAGDLFMACLILRKQIELIHGNKENIIIPSVKMRQIQEENGKFRVMKVCNRCFFEFKQ